MVADPVLAGFIAAYEQKKWEPGKVDCCLALAAWAIWLGYPDPARDFRGAYSSEEGFHEIFARVGGPVPLVASCADLIGARPVKTPSCGDIGVVGSPASYDRQFGAIFDGERWRVRFIDRYGAVVASPLAIWRI